MDIQKKLRELKEMHEQGLISSEVYSEQQKALLATHMMTGGGNSTETPKAQAAPPKTGRPLWQRLLMAAFIVLAGIWIFYKLSDRQGKDAINQFASQTSIGTQVIPWADRADTIARRLISQNQDKIANAIQGLTHPTGKDAKLIRSSISKLDGRILIEMTVAWKGGFIGNDYETVVAWEISEANHVSAKVVSDTAMTEIESKNKEMLNDYFKNRVYPAFYSSISGNS